jgi:TRAP-type C4-dicarboxylate transport system permease small subunit
LGTAVSDQAAAAPAALPVRVGWATRCLDGLDAVLGLVLVVLLAGIVLDVAAGVISRYVFNASFRWTEEIGYLLFLWLIFTGISVAHRRRLHISVAVLSLVLPPSARPVLHFLANAVVAYTTFVLVASGWDAMVLIGDELPTLGWPNEGARRLPAGRHGAVQLRDDRRAHPRSRSSVRRRRSRRSHSSCSSS